MKGGHKVAGNQVHINFICFLQNAILVDFATCKPSYDFTRGNCIDGPPNKEESRRLQIAQVEGWSSIRITNHTMISGRFSCGD
ncbi:protein of unknown function [Candidatus Nitrotoga arctica]|uniref:Uncharacterized protein n=1 Tax=Candidatus Nitrotoga arctica TaxID=453162 RepID=A0ABM8YW47_9PROT|nr:protein of unknown function [Candidatus Nitrotoga arctica]